MWFLILFLALSLGQIDAAPPGQSRVVGGYNCETNSQPWQVAVIGTTFCGGVLIDPSWVITAAHCYSKNYRVLLGRNNLVKDEPFAQRRLVSQSFQHPDYIPVFMRNHTRQRAYDHNNDLMLLHLSKPADITGGVKVIDLPTEEPKVGSICLASGWGMTNPSEMKLSHDLQCVNIHLLSNEKCIETYKNIETDVTLCAGEMDGGKDTCTGDSGGPLICDGVLQGLTSGGATPCAKPKTPAIYAKLIKFTSWIKKVMKENP
ncbi:rCG54431 [Rattus norvegicus]|uniref:Submandibular glandular kallikrein-9 n=2 Tax=Rattus norvegicus TaxID=10116 RepID=KLK9_RAT|nr:submandibular glandular kallikrein-9 precursor [Rattus norvegicus]P07647.1 RecName: Full=Submandibular glandular kallikrein-9; Short=rGK-9; AltName: Full=KLK-S3; AltName: Full=S3 kallikrein; AltName: Full=Submandibular enzymatic vasoconstrictor; Short=SEV; AltName: Full=Tissue kallikrein; Contains: RecName: Full=Submandibular glandular kallikrein-9 light chain; Contains: RecName: Full=Submandibular glandular kallikrein-9 heavy chain; Flags: Precursor [Rattus norvegicus]AAA41467.1 S3 kallikrein|eukprot:NP_786935.1 submandibular glandular kallikrein-9 precursor [Rattus norvegicus]